MVKMIMNWNVGPICSKLYVSSCGVIEIPNNHKVSLLSYVSLKGCECHKFISI